MCLYKGYNKMQTASEDMVCYKVIEIINGKMVSYYQQTPIQLNVPIKALDPCDKSDMNEHTTLTGEVVHSYKSECIPEEYLNKLKVFSTGYHSIRLSRGYKVSIAILKCIIPKGTLYCCNIPISGYQLHEYGSVELIPKEIIAEYKLEDY